MKANILIVTAAALLVSHTAYAEEPAKAPNISCSAADTGEPHKHLLSLEDVKKQPHGDLGRVVLDFLTVMDRVVNKPKQPAITAADWQPLGDLIDRTTFRRVGNYGVRNDWPSYVGLLTQWANHSYWKGCVWRMREVRGEGKSGLVYLETEERSNQRHPVKDDGDYSTLASIAVYEINGDGKVSALWVYDQRPL